MNPPWEGSSKHLTQEFEDFAVTLMGGDASEACWPEPRREQHADVADALRPQEDSACAVELGPRGVGGGRRDELAQRDNYLPVLADLMTETVLFATPFKDSAVWKAFSAELL